MLDRVNPVRRRPLAVLAIVLLAGAGLAAALTLRTRDHAPPPASGAPKRRADARRDEPARGLESSAAPLLGAIGELESKRDPKCHSTACRFEDFVYGTPLSDDARDERIELEKELARSLWTRASRAAIGAGEATVAPARLVPLVAELYACAIAPEGDATLTFAGGAVVSLSAVRARQYASITYSLRAILAVQQDLFLEGGEVLLTLAPESIALLREVLDGVTLCALQLADREAREQSRPRIVGLDVRAAWRALVPEPADPARARRGRARLMVPASADSRAQAARLLEGIAAEKTSAYRAYNDVEPERARDLFLYNTVRFYALYPLPTEGAQLKPILAAFDGGVAAFCADLVGRAGGRGVAAGRRVIRAEDVAAAVQELLPQRIDDFEDVHLFERLPAGERVTLESYDCDSLRDFGRHWQLLQSGVASLGERAPPLDPFAAEIAAEAASQYGVLLLRRAGVAAKRRRGAAVLEVADVERAALDIGELARAHHAAPKRELSAAGIVSASAASGAPGEQLFFSDVSAGSGIAFVHRSAVWLAEFRRAIVDSPPTFSGGGIAAADVDGDADMDLFFVGGGGNALYHNDGTGRFEDATVAAGLAWLRPDGTAGEARQPLILDLDDDALPDVVVTYVADDHRVWRNAGDGRFEDVSARAGLGGAGLVGGPVTAFDMDQDGRLDLYVGYFGDYLNGALPLIDRHSANALENRLFRNQGGLRFEDVTRGSGTGDTGWTQAVSHTDFDRDGKPDLIVANDYGRNAFLRNLGGGQFVDAAPSFGMTEAYHSMNVGISDLNDDGFPEVYISNIATMVKDNKYVMPDVNTPLDFDRAAMAGMLVKESNVLYVSRVEQGRLVGYDPSPDVERGATSTGWAWDAEFFDFDNDGDDDLYCVNGTNDYNYFYAVHAFEGAGGEVAHVFLDHARESNVFFVNEGGKLRNRSGESGADLLANSRSTAYLDLEGDGDLDIAINNFHAPAALLRNETRGNAWLGVRLVGDPALGSSRDAVGARIRATTPLGRRIAREVQGGSGYLSMNPPVQHFGLGAAASADLEITWPNGEVELVGGAAANRLHTLRQGERGARSE